jgi:hypothetical protein
LIDGTRPRRRPWVGTNRRFSVYCGVKVNQAKKQHQLAVSLLKTLGLDYVRLEPGRNGHYRYHAWNAPLVDGNGSPRVSRQGAIRRHQT